MSRKLAFAVLLIAGLLPNRAQPQNTPDVVAVFDVEVSGLTLKRAAVDGLSDYLFGKVAGSGFKVVPRAEVKKRLREEAKESYKACYDESCQIEIGRELAAQKTISTKILKLGDECNVSVVLYDLRSSATDTAADVSGGCAPGALARSLEKAVATLARANAAPVAAAVAPQMGEVDPEHCPEPGTRRMGDPPPKGQSVYCLNAENKMHGLMKTWHPTGKLATSAGYRDGQLEGKQRLYHRNGELHSEGENRGGKRHGLWVTYWDDGKKQEEGRYEAGAKTGVWTRYGNDGVKHSETEHRGDMRQGESIEYWPSGAVKERGQHAEDKKSGVWVSFRQDGAKREEEAYEAGKLHGPRISYDGKGNKESVTTYAAGKRHGRWERWLTRPDGTLHLRTTSAYQDDQQHGERIEYDDQGEPRELSTWAQGKKHGPTTRWSRSGDVRFKAEEGGYASGERHGVWRRFDLSGQVTSEETWAEGKKNGPATTWSKGRAGVWYKSRAGQYQHDKQEGRWIVYRPDGAVEREENYVQGQRQR